MKQLVFCLVTWLAMSWSGAVLGHATNQSYIFLTVAGDTIDVRSEITIADLNLALDLGLPEDSLVTDDLLLPRVPEIRRYVLERLALAPDGTRVELANAGFGIMPTSHGQFVQTRYRISKLTSNPEFINVEYRALFDVKPDHTAFLVIENNWLTATFDNEAQIALTFTQAQQSARLDLSQSSILRGFAGMVEMGMHHIWIGIDHVLFLMALLLPSVMRRIGKTWEPLPDIRSALIQVLKIVTVFTIAHTVTLSLAALAVISLSSRLVESVIAISIAIVAIDILVPMFRNWVYSIVLAFGLFHGFGFASVLGELPIPSSYMVWSLLGFNLGVEIGQVAIVAVAVPILFMLRNWWFYPRWSMPTAAVALIVISMYWFVERAFNVDLPAGEIVNRVLAWI